MDNLVDSALEVRVTVDEILGHENGPRSKAKNSVFLAFLVNDPNSRSFRNHLQNQLGKQGIHVETGELDGGEKWGPEIRRRIARCKLFIADVTGPSPEVLFEVGFAARKPSLFVTRSLDSLEKVKARSPWITTTQALTYEGTGVSRISERVENCFLSRRFPAAAHSSQPKPGHIVALFARNSAKWSAFRDQAQELVAKNSLDLHVIDPTEVSSSEDLAGIATGWIFLSGLSGGPEDRLTHYLAGEVAFRPRAGAGRLRDESVQRKVIVLSDPPNRVNEILAQSVKTLSASLVYKARDEMDALAALKRAVTDYRKFLNTEE